MCERYSVSGILIVHANANTDLFCIMTKILDLTLNLKQRLSYVGIHKAMRIKSSIYC
jgi:hypothetical protein